MQDEIIRHISVAVKPTPEELAEVFWSFDADQQARFFNVLAVVSDHRLPAQLHQVKHSLLLTPVGKQAMQTIGEYGK